MKTLSRISLLVISFFMTTTLFAVQDANEGQPLPADQAFKQSVTVKDQNSIQANWAIEKSYYLYRNKFKFTSKTKGIEIGSANIPAGKKKNDPSFGVVQIFRKNVSIQIPLKRIDKSLSKFDLEVTSQGCADIGICYPPQTKTVSLTLAALSNSDTKTDATKADDGKSATKKLSDFGTGFGTEQDEEFLANDKAFALSTEYKDNKTLITRWVIADGYYLYRNKIKFKLMNAPAGVTLGTPQIPKGKLKKDPAFGDVWVFYKQVEIRIPVLGAKKGQKIKVAVTSQGCANKGLCYPPSTKLITLGQGMVSPVISDAPAGTLPLKANTSSNDNTVNDSDASLSDRILGYFKKALAGDNYFVSLVIMLLLGLFVAFTACMYPMIPLVCMFVIGQGEKASKMRGFVLSGTYVVSMATVFGVMGGLAGYFGGIAGTSISASMQDPWILGPVIGLMLLLSLAMFGAINIQMPSVIQNKIDNISRNQKGGTLIGAAIVGALAALIVGPCGGPFLLAAIGYAATTESMIIGYFYLFIFGIGMGLPLILVGIYGSDILPKAGNWMSMVKATGGIVLVALALFFAERLFRTFEWSMSLYMMLWAVLLIMTGIYYRALEPVPAGASGKRYMLKGLAIIIFLWGILVALGGLTGGQFVSDPLQGSSLTSGTANIAPSTQNTRKGRYISGKKTKTKGSLKFVKIKSVEDLKREIKAANAAGFNVMLDFYATWCTYCIQFDVYVFSKPDVVNALSNTILLVADVTKNDAVDKQLLKFVNVQAPPAIIFYGKDGKEAGKRIYALMKKKRFLKRVERAFGKK